MNNYWVRHLDQIKKHINLGCIKGMAGGNYKGMIIADDPDHILEYDVKQRLDYNLLCSSNKVCNITIDGSWLFNTEENRFLLRILNALNAVPEAKHGLLEIHVSDIRAFGYCRSLKVLAKQENYVRDFDGYVMLVIDGLSWDDVKAYAIKHHNNGQFDAMWDFYHRVQ